MQTIQRLLSDWMLVRVEPAKQITVGGIVIPGTHEAPVRTGHVLMTGPGRNYTDKFVPMPDLIGQRVAFMIAASQTKSGKAVRTQICLAENEEIIRLGDVLLVVEEGVEVSK